MEFQTMIPIYIQIATDIKEKIIRGELVEGEKINSIREYASFYCVTTLTVQRALQFLEQEQIIWIQKGIGSFVKEGSKNKLEYDMMKEQVQGFIHSMRKMKFSDEAILSIVKKELGGVSND